MLILTLPARLAGLLYMGPLTPEAETWEQDEALDLGGL